MDEFGGIGLHQFDAGPQGIGHVDHVHVNVARDGAGETARPHGLVINLHGVVGRAAAGQRDVGDDAGEAHRTRIDAVFMVIVVAQHLAGILADAVDGRGLHDGVLRRAVLGRRGAEGADRRRGEEGAMVLARHFERIVQRPHVDAPGHLGVALADGRKERHKVEDRVDMVAGDDGSHGRGIEGVQHLERSGLAQLAAVAHVGGHDVRIAVNLAQMACQLGTDLTAGAYDKDFLHGL